MILKEVAALINAELLCCEQNLSKEIECACGSDMMSEVLAFTKYDAVLLTGLNNIQVLRTAEMLDISSVIFVRGKKPNDEMLEMAVNMGISLFSTEMPMFNACGILYSNGIKGGMRKD